MWDERRINKFPPSGTWWENAPNPVLPVKGIPANPPKWKTLPKNSAKMLVISPFLWLISSGQTEKIMNFRNSSSGFLSKFHKGWPDWAYNVLLLSAPNLDRVCLTSLNTRAPSFDPNKSKSESKSSRYRVANEFMILICMHLMENINW